MRYAKINTASIPKAPALAGVVIFRMSVIATADIAAIMTSNLPNIPSLYLSKQKKPYVNVCLSLVSE
ncbi:hypothetical protein EON76_02485 [bacterium]|nr:MAG: hypothetical protein EON76_02485 [bacterium]